MDILVVLLPTILFVVIVLYQMLRGFMRGQRKSLYLLINMAIAMVVSLILFLSWTNIGGLTIVTESFPELEDQLTDAVEFVIGDKTLDVMMAYISLIVNLIVLIVIQLIVYPTVKAILYIIYLFFFRGRVVDDKDEGNTRRIGGMLIGGLRGLIVGFLVFSQFSTLYYVVAGGVFYSSEEYDSLDIPFSELGLDESTTEMIDSIYKGFKTYRSTGLGAGFEKLSIGGNSLDYIFLDFVISGSYENFSGDKTKVTIREEFGNLVGVFATVVETGLIKFEEGKMVPDLNKMDEKNLSAVALKLSQTNLFVDGIPTVLIDFVNNNEDVLGMEIDAELLKKLDLENDIKEVAIILANFVSMIDVENFTDFSSIDFYNLDGEVVDTIIDSLSKMTFMVDIMLPLGVNFISASVEELVFDLDGIIWNEELQNLKGLYGTLQDLGLREGFDGLLTTVEQALENNDEQTVEKFNSVIEQVFSSDLVYRLTSSVMEMTIKNLTSADGELSDLNIDMSKYSRELFREDIDILVNNIVGGYSLYKQVTGDGFLEEGFETLDIEGLRQMLLGSGEGANKTLGIMDLNIITECTDEDEFYYTLFSVAADGLIDLPEGLVWRSEVNAMFDVLTTIQNSSIDLNALMSGDFTALSQISESDSIKLTDAICDSVLITTLFVTTLTGEDSPLGDMLEIPTGINWYGDEGEIKSLLTSIFHIVRMDGVLEGLLEGDFTVILNALTKNDIDVLLDSQVLSATLSVQLINLGDGLLEIPSDLIDNNGYIESTEVKSLLTALVTIGLDFENLDMNIFFDENIEYSVIFNSRIITATISTMLIDLDVFSIPDSVRDGNYIESTELENLMEALRSLDLDFDNITVDSFLNADTDILFSSEILRATVSSALTSSNLKVNNSVIDSEGYITKAELTALFNGFKALGINSLDNMDFASILMNTSDFTTALESVILHETLSDTLTAVLNVPVTYQDNASTQVNVVVDGILIKEEITNYINAIKLLKLTDVDGVIDLDVIITLTDDQIDTLTSSYIMCSLVSGFDVIKDSGFVTVVEVQGTNGNISIAYRDDIRTVLKMLN